MGEVSNGGQLVNSNALTQTIFHDFYGQINPAQPQTEEKVESGDRYVAVGETSSNVPAAPDSRSTAAVKKSAGERPFLTADELFTLYLVVPIALVIMIGGALMASITPCSPLAIPSNGPSNLEI